METLGKRVRSRRKELDLTQKELAKKIGVHPITITQWETDKKEAAHNNLKSLAQALGVSTDFLLTGREIPPSSEFTVSAMPTQHDLPILNKIAAAHLPGASHSKEKMSVDARFARANHYCLTVSGQSMSPKIDEGDVVVIEKVYFRLEPLFEELGQADKTIWMGLNNKVVAASIDGDDPILKRLRVQERKGKDTQFKIWLRSDNPRADWIEVTRENRLEVFGIVRQIIRDPDNI